MDFDHNSGELQNTCGGTRTRSTSSCYEQNSLESNSGTFPKVESNSSEFHTIRINPVVAKQLGLKLCKSERTSTSDIYGLAPVDDSIHLELHQESLRIPKKPSYHEHKCSNRALSGMFNIPRKYRICRKREDESLASRENYKMPPKKVSWWQVTLFLLNDINNVWLMFSSVIVYGINGWALGTMLLVSLWPVNTYVAHLLWRCRNVFPGAISIGDLVYYLTGSSWAMYITFFCVNITIALTLGYNIFWAASSMYWLSGLTTQMCFTVFLAGACLILLPLTQLRTLHSLTIINVINLVCILCFAGIYMYFLAYGGRDADAVTRVGPNVDAWQNILVFGNGDGEEKASPLVGLDLVITAYHYQLLVLEIMAEMKDPRDFPKANYWCTPVVLFVTLGCAGFRYYYQGEETSLTLSTPLEVLSSTFERSQSGLAYFGMTCFTLQILGSCLVRSVILTRSTQLLIHPKSLNVRSWWSHLEWAGISLFVLLLAYALSFAAAVVLPLAEYIGIMTIALSIVMPVILYLVCRGRMKQLRHIPWYEWLFMLIIIIASAAITIVYFLKVGYNTNDFNYFESNYTATQFDIITSCQHF